MNAEQKQRAAELLAAWRATAYALHGDRMAALPQELVDAPEHEPFGYFKSEPFGWTDCAETDDGAIALYTAPPAPSVPDAHPDDIAVDRFAAAMKTKMAKSRAVGRYGWDDPAVCSADDLRLFLTNHIAKGDPVDVGNFAMMLFNRHETTAQPHPEPPADLVQDSVASEPVGYLYTNLQSGEYHVSDADDDYRGPERVLWCIEPVYRRAKGQS